MKHLILVLSIIIGGFNAQAQKAEEIIARHIEVMGGAKWSEVKGLRMSTNVEQGGMKIPLEIVMMNDGKMYTKITIQGMEIIQGAFDGTVLWSTNFMTQKAEKSDAESTENAKRSAGEFPSALYTYGKLGYKVTSEGEETVDGVACYKIRMDKKTQLVEGKEVPDVEYYYIDKETSALLMTEEAIPSGEMAGQVAQTKYSDYQEVDGVFVAFSQSMGLKDGASQGITFEKVELNPSVDPAVFAYPGTN